MLLKVKIYIHTYVSVLALTRIWTQIQTSENSQTFIFSDIFAHFICT